MTRRRPRRLAPAEVTAAVANARPDRTWERDADPLPPGAASGPRSGTRGSGCGSCHGFSLVTPDSKMPDLRLARCPLCPRVLGCSLEGTSHELTNKAERAGGTPASGHCCSARWPGCSVPWHQSSRAGQPTGPFSARPRGECLGCKRVCQKVPKRSVWALADMVLKSLSLCSPVPSAGTSLPCCVVCHRSPG